MNAVRKRKPAALTRPSACSARFQGGDGRRFETGQPGGVGLRAHKRSVAFARHAQPHEAGQRNDDGRPEGDDDGGHWGHASVSRLLGLGGGLGVDKWKHPPATVNLIEVGNQWLNRLDCRVWSVATRQLARQCFGNASFCRDQLKLRLTESAKPAHKGIKDCAHAAIVFPFAGSCQPMNGKACADDLLRE